MGNKKYVVENNLTIHYETKWLSNWYHAMVAKGYKVDGKHEGYWKAVSDSGQLECELFFKRDIVFGEKLYTIVL